MQPSHVWCDAEHHAARIAMRVLLRTAIPGADFSDAVMDQVAADATITTFDAGARVCSSDSRDGDVRFQISGVLKEQLWTEEGGVLTVRFLGPGNMFSAAPCLPKPWGYRAGFVAHERAVVATVPGATFVRALQHVPAAKAAELARQSWRTTTDRLLRKLQFLSLPMVDRIKSELVTLARTLGRAEELGVVLRTVVSDQELAYLVGGSRANVTRCLGTLRAAGLIERVGRRLFIADRLLVGPTR